MDESSIINAVINYGFETVAIAFIINILTTVIKIPVKKYAEKLDDGGVTLKKYITFLPIVLGCILAVIYTYIFVSKTDIFTEEFMVLWLTSSSLSLALYAVFEKFFPKSDIDSDVLTDEMKYSAYRLIESLSDIKDPKDLMTLSKLVYNKIQEFKENEETDYTKLSEVLKGLIPDESLDAVSKALFEKFSTKETEENAATTTATTEAATTIDATAENPTDMPAKIAENQKIILKNQD